MRLQQLLSILVATDENDPIRHLRCTAYINQMEINIEGEIIRWSYTNNQKIATFKDQASSTQSQIIRILGYNPK